MDYGKQWTVINGNDHTSATTVVTEVRFNVMADMFWIATMSILIGCRLQRLIEQVSVQVSWWAESWI
ncbi:hypothetical protein ABVC73_12705 [Prevotella melaninogenica]